MNPQVKTTLRWLLLVVAFILALAASLAFGGLFKWSLDTDLALVAGSLASFYASCLVT